MPTVDVERLSFVDVSEKKVGNFMQPENLDRFLASEVGKAQEKMMREQMVGQGFKAEDISTSMIRRALFSEQASQEYGRQPDLTTKKLLDSHGPAWYESLGNLVSSWGKAGKEGTEAAVRVGAEAAVEGVTHNSGMSGDAARALSGREAQIETAVNQALGIKP